MHVIDGLPFGGAERMLVEIANQTAASGHKVSVCVTRSDTEMASILRNDIDVWVLNRNRRFDWASLIKFSQIVKNQKVKILHAHSRSTLAFLALGKTLQVYRTPIIMHDHFGIELNNSVPIWFRFWAKYWVDHYVGVYEKLATWGEDAGINPQKISVIDNALDLTKLIDVEPLNIKNYFGLPADSLIGIVVGNLRQEKGIDNLLQAISLSASEKPMRILVVGNQNDKVYAEKCFSQQTSLGLHEIVLFLGERQDVPRLLGGADFALLPSRSESGPLVLIECMAFALPFVATQVGGISHKVAEMGVPEFVEPDNPVAFAAAMDRLLSLSGSERQKRGKIGQKIAIEHFDISQQMRRWVKIYDAVLENTK
ncbi:MAG: glycosyltransferase [Thermoplasmata archaeon]|nr:glycosyltransferase [Thermoplasmata archaeon]